MPISIIFDEHDEFRWTSIETHTSEDGVLENKKTIFDNGIEKIEGFYADGQKYYSIQTDPENVKYWDRIDVLYEEDGSLEQRTIVKDDGGYTQWSYDFGQILRKVEIDGEFDGGSKKWAGRFTEYNENGQKSEVSTIFDDHRVRTETFNDDGSKRTVVEDYSEDGSDFIWDAKISLKGDDGKLIHQGVFYDNDDVTLTLFESGVRANRLDIDGDESHSWYAREFIFDENGKKVDIVYYQSNEEIPDYWNTQINNPIADPNA